MSDDSEIQKSFPFEIFEEELVDPLSGHALSETEAFLASLLLEATSENPIRIKQIITALDTSYSQKV